MRSYLWSASMPGMKLNFIMREEALLILSSGDSKIKAFRHSLFPLHINKLKQSGL